MVDGQREIPYANSTSAMDDLESLARSSRFLSLKRRPAARHERYRKTLQVHVPPPLLRTQTGERSQRRAGRGELGPSQRAVGGWYEIARCCSCVFGRSWFQAVAASRSVKLAGSPNKDHACAGGLSFGVQFWTPIDSRARNRTKKHAAFALRRRRLINSG